jgi:hypothetical protein
MTSKETYETYHIGDVVLAKTSDPSNGISGSEKFVEREIVGIRTIKDRQYVRFTAGFVWFTTNWIEGKIESKVMCGP